MKYKPLSEIIDLGTLYESHAKETFYIALYQINYKVGVEMS